MARIAAVFVVSVAYAAVRYVAFAPDNLAHLPVFVVNKGTSMAAALCFALAFWEQWRRRGSTGAVEPAAWFRAGVLGAVVHVPMSLAILRPAYFPEFFPADGGRMTTNGEAVFLCGALTAGGIYLLTRGSWSARGRWWLSLATMTTLFAHALCMGVARGLQVNRSHAYLPPMWLLSLVGIVLGTAFLLLVRPDPGDGGEPPAGPAPP
jgi:hypothetical protein